MFFLVPFFNNLTTTPTVDHWHGSRSGDPSFQRSCANPVRSCISGQDLLNAFKTTGTRAPQLTFPPLPALVFRGTCTDLLAYLRSTAPDQSNCEYTCASLVCDAFKGIECVA